MRADLFNVTPIRPSVTPAAMGCPELVAFVSRLAADPRLSDSAVRTMNVLLPYFHPLTAFPSMRTLALARGVCH